MSYAVETWFLMDFAHVSTCFVPNNLVTTQITSVPLRKPPRWSLVCRAILHQTVWSGIFSRPLSSCAVDEDHDDDDDDEDLVKTKTNMNMMVMMSMKIMRMRMNMKMKIQVMMRTRKRTKMMIIIITTIIMIVVIIINDVFLYAWFRGAFRVAPLMGCN